MPKSPRTGRRTDDRSLNHHPLHDAPGGDAVPGPEATKGGVFAGLRFANRELPVERRYQARRQRHLPHDVASPLQGGEGDDPALHLERCRRQSEDLTDPRACPNKGESEERLPWSERTGCSDHPLALSEVQILPASIWRVEAGRGRRLAAAYASSICIQIAHIVATRFSHFDQNLAASVC